MKKINYKLITIIGIVFLMYSCEEFTEPVIEDMQPYYVLSEQATFSTVANCKSVLASAYESGVKQLSVSSLNWVYSSLAGGANTVFSNNDFSDNSLSITSNTSMRYRDLYNGIQTANYLIRALQSDNPIDALSSDERIEIEAEARILRAFLHLLVLRTYGEFYDVNSIYGVVTSTEPIEFVEPIPQSTVQESYDVILSDLNYGIESGSATHTAHRFNKHSAKALKAKVLLYMQDWDGAASLALETINNNAFELKSDFTDVFKDSYLGSEIIFAPLSSLPDETISMMGGGLEESKVSPYLKSVADMGIDDGDPDTDIDSDGVLTRFTYTGYDPRFGWSFTRLGMLSSCNKYPSNKYNLPLFGADGPNNTHWFMRLAEFYLIYAEAKARSGSGVDADALASLNIIRNRAGVPDVTPTTKAELLDAIRLEKILELFFEDNQCWYDLVRYHILGDINITDIKSSIVSENQLIWS